METGRIESVILFSKEVMKSFGPSCFMIQDEVCKVPRYSIKCQGILPWCCMDSARSGIDRSLTNNRLGNESATGKGYRVLSLSPDTHEIYIGIRNPPVYHSIGKDTGYKNHGTDINNSGCMREEAKNKKRNKPLRDILPYSSLTPPRPDRSAASTLFLSSLTSPCMPERKPAAALKGLLRSPLAGFPKTWILTRLPSSAPFNGMMDWIRSGFVYLK